MENLIFMVVISMALSGGLFLILFVGTLVMGAVKLFCKITLILAFGFFGFIDRLERDQKLRR